LLITSIIFWYLDPYINMLGLKDSKTQKHYNIILSPSMCQKIILKNQVMVKFFMHTRVILPPKSFGN